MRPYPRPSHALHFSTSPYPTVSKYYVKQLFPLALYRSGVGGQANPFLAHDGRGRVSRHANFKRPPLTGWGPLSRLITTLAHCSTHKTCITGCANGGAEQVLQFLCGLKLCQTFATSRAEQSIAVHCNGLNHTPWQ